MRPALKLLFLLVTLQSVTGLLVSRRIGRLRPWKSCNKGQYYSEEDSTCYDCQTCDDFYYESEGCTSTSDTVCEWCGDEPNFAEESEKVLDAYENSCMIGRMEYIHKSELVKQWESIHKYGSDSEERQPVEESKETDENEIDIVSETEELDNEVETSCDEAQYYNAEMEMCFNCTQCGHFLYETAKCTKTSNTACVWCGEEPNFKKISDIVLASYQNKCLMVQLDFVDMNELFEDDDESRQNTDEDNEEVSEKDAIISANVKLALEKKEEDDLIRHLKLKSGQVSSEEEEKEDSGDSEEEDLDKSVSKNVNAYLNGKKSLNRESESAEAESNKHNSEENVADIVEIRYGYNQALREEINSVEELDSQDPFSEESSSELKQREPPRTLQLLTETNEVQEDSTEEFDDRLIKWDRWVDDEVKPIRNIEIVEAEEIRLSDDTVMILNNGEIDNGEMIGEENVSSGFLNFFVMWFFGTAVLFTCILYLCIKAQTKKTVFLGVPTDSPDYHMILDASHYIEELEKREKKASRHIHENPIFDI